MKNILKILTSVFNIFFLIVLSYFAVDNTKLIFRFLNTKILTLYSASFYISKHLVTVKYILFKDDNKNQSSIKKLYNLWCWKNWC